MAKTAWISPPNSANTRRNGSVISQITRPMINSGTKTTAPNVRAAMTRALKKKKVSILYARYASMPGKVPNGTPKGVRYAVAGLMGGTS